MVGEVVGDLTGDLVGDVRGEIGVELGRWSWSFFGEISTSIGSSSVGSSLIFFGEGVNWTRSGSRALLTGEVEYDEDGSTIVFGVNMRNSGTGFGGVESFDCCVKNELAV